MIKGSLLITAALFFAVFGDGMRPGEALTNSEVSLSCHWRRYGLFTEDKINCQDEEAETYPMVPTKRFGFEQQGGENHKYYQGDYLLQHFEFNQGKWTSVSFETKAVGRHLEKILKQGNAPADEDNGQQPQVLKPLHFVKFEVAIPGKSHEDVRQNKEADGVEGFHGF